MQEYMVGIGLKEGLVLLSGAMIFVATIIMVWAIIKAKGRKSASMVPWLIWSVVTAVTATALLHAHATRWELLIPLSQLGSMLLIMLATAYVLFRYGGWRKERIRRGDGWALIVCIVFVGAGLYFDEPYVTLWGNFAANFVGLIPIYLEGRADPGGVTRWYWIFRGLSTSAATAVCVVDGWRLALLIPTSMGLIIVVAMLWASIKWHPKPSRVLRTTITTDDAHPMLTIGTLFR